MTLKLLSFTGWSRRSAVLGTASRCVRVLHHSSARTFMTTNLCFPKEAPAHVVTKRALGLRNIAHPRRIHRSVSVCSWPCVSVLPFGLVVQATQIAHQSIVRTPHMRQHFKQKQKQRNTHLNTHHQNHHPHTTRSAAKIRFQGLWVCSQ
jgi:hypothetical protein